MHASEKAEQMQGSLISHMSGLVKQHGGINLAQGLPGFPPPSELLDELQHVIHGNCHQYPQGDGDPELIRVIRSMYQPVYDLEDDQILVVQGATEAISLTYLYLIKKFGNRWNSLAFDPVYESYAHLPEIYGNKLVRATFNHDGSIPWESISQMISSQKVKLVFINSPGNPSSRVWTESEVDKLHRMAEEEDFYIIFDGVYNKLYFDSDSPYNPVNKLMQRLFYVNSYSKLLSITGWRIGYLICSSEQMKEIKMIHDYTGLCAPSLLQKAIANYLLNNKLGSDYISELRKQLEESYKTISGELQRLGFQYKDVTSGYFIWAKLPDNRMTGMEFCLNLYREQRVAIVPGIHFSPNGGNYVRINFARSASEIHDAIRGINEFIRS